MSFNARFEQPTLNELEEMGRSECPFTKKCDEYDCEICKNKGSENVNKYVTKSILLNAAIENEFAPLDWIDITVHEEEGTGSISFAGPRIKTEDGETCNSAGFRGREDAFFAKMRRIRDMIKICGMSADLIKFDADRECPYSEATINIDFEGGEL